MYYYNGKCNLSQLCKILNIDYVTGLDIVNEKLIEPVEKKERLTIFTNGKIEEFLLHNKENTFLFSFEKASKEKFIDRMVKEELYDLRNEKEIWLQPKVLKFLFNLSPWDLEKLRNNDLVQYKKDYNPNKKKTSRNKFTYLYNKKSLIEYATSKWGDKSLQKPTFKVVYDPQFYTVQETLAQLNKKGLDYSLTTLYRNIERDKVPAIRIRKYGIRVPIKEFEETYND
jgi:hypothetical protein